LMEHMAEIFCFFSFANEPSIIQKRQEGEWDGHRALFQCVSLMTAVSFKLPMDGASCCWLIS
jgi:hypothetical protein